MSNIPKGTVTAITVANGREDVLAKLEKYRMNDLLTRSEMAVFIAKMDANTGSVIQLHHGTIQYPGDLLKDGLILMNEGQILHQVNIGDFFRKNDRPNTTPDKPTWSDGINWDRKFNDR